MNTPITFGFLRKNRTFYAKLRCYAVGIILDLILKNRRTIQQAADRHGLKLTTYYRLRMFVCNHRDAVDEALRTGNWRPVEGILFPKLFATHPECPDFDAALKAATAEWRRRGRKGIPLPQHSRKVPAKAKKIRKGPKPTVRETPSWFGRLFRKFGHWLG